MTDQIHSATRLETQRNLSEVYDSIGGDVQKIAPRLGTGKRLRIDFCVG